VGERENLGRVGERNGPFTWRVKGSKQEDKEGNEADVSGARFRDVETESGSQEGPGHLGESEQKKGSSSIGIDGPDGRPGETDRIRKFRRNEGIFSDIHVVHETETERSKQSLKGCSTSLDENRRRIEGNNINCSRSRVSALYKADSDRIYLLPHIC
jgi:hypothetical protein